MVSGRSTPLVLSRKTYLCTGFGIILRDSTKTGGINIKASSAFMAEAWIMRKAQRGWNGSLVV